MVASAPDTRPSVRAPVVRLALASCIGIVLASCGGGDGAAPAAVPPSTPTTPPPPPAPTVTSLEVSGTGVLTSIGETAQLMVTATLSDGSTQAVDGARVEWESADAAVATVSAGLVTAAGGGNVTITAAYDGVSAEVVVSVLVSHRTKGTVRLLYVVPQNGQFRVDYGEAIAYTMAEVQSWFRRQLEGLTFDVYDMTPERCQLAENADFYDYPGADVRGNVLEGVQHCAPVELLSPDFVWVIYVDFPDTCHPKLDTLGTGGAGVATLGRGDLVGSLAFLRGEAQSTIHNCEGTFVDPAPRWAGGLAHELAHTMGVPHPPECEDRLPTCDGFAVMSYGWDLYPDTYLRFDDKETLMRSPFIRGERQPEDGAITSTIEGRVLGPTGVPVEGVRVSLAADPFWTWGETARDGTFSIGFPEDVSGPFVASLHGGNATECKWLGYHGTSGLTSRRDRAVRVVAGAESVEIGLPEIGRCAENTTVRGTVVGPDGRPEEDVWVTFFDDTHLTGREGTFSLTSPSWIAGIPSPFFLHVERCSDGERSFLFGPGGLSRRFSEAGSFEVGLVPLEEIEIRFPPAVCESSQ